MTVRLTKMWRLLGPGFVTGSADDDPSGIGTYSQAGAQYGLSQLWTGVWVFPFLAAFQEICGRIGLVTGRGLAAVLRDGYPRWVCWGAVGLLAAANTTNLAADLGAMAATCRMLAGGGPFAAWMAVIVAATLALQVGVPYQRYFRYLKWAGLSLLAYMATAVIVGEDWRAVAWRSFVPWSDSWSSGYLFNLIAVIGTSITPFAFFWMTQQEAEENFRLGRVKAFGAAPRLRRHDLRDMRIDDAVGMAYCQIIQWAIILTCAATLHRAGITRIDAPEQAAAALRPLAGGLTYALFAAAIVGIGLSAVPVMSGSAAQAIVEASGRLPGRPLRASLSYTAREAPVFYGIIVAATLAGAALNFAGIPPFRLLYFAAAANGVLAVPLVAVITHVGNNPRVMGGHTNNRFANAMGWATCAVMAGCTAALFASALLNR